MYGLEFVAMGGQCFYRRARSRQRKTNMVMVEKPSALLTQSSRFVRMARVTEAWSYPIIPTIMPGNANRKVVSYHREAEANSET